LAICLAPRFLEPEQPLHHIRTPASVMTEMSEMLKRENPLKVYNKLVLKHDELSGPSTGKVIK
jgi:hypothetical protein